MNSTANQSSGGGAESTDTISRRRRSRKPKYSKFTQQEIPACRPILTPKRVVAVFFLVSFIFILIGAFSLIASQSVVEIVDQYEVECIPKHLRNDKVGFIQSSQNKTCTRTLRVPKHMTQPIYVYYQLTNFHQNHLRYMNSRNDRQLTRENESKSCKHEDWSINNRKIVPCGLIAWSLFNDTYDFTRDNQKLSINKKGIAWKTDRGHKFGRNVFPKDFQKSRNGRGGASLDTSIPMSEQEDLMVWMRTAALPQFRKLYGKIETNLEAGDIIRVTLQNNYNTYSFKGKKMLVLSTTTWIGGKNNFLGIAYLVIGGLCFLLAMFYRLSWRLISLRELGDLSYLSWNQRNGRIEQPLRSLQYNTGLIKEMDTPLQ